MGPDSEDENGEVEGKSTRATTLAATALVLTLFALGAILVPNYLRHAQHRDFGQCQAHVNNIAIALQVYRADHEGRLPATLGHLIPQYLSAIPICPANGYDTYSDSFERLESRPPLRFRVGCRGYHGPDVPRGAPVYDSQRGFLKP